MKTNEENTEPEVDIEQALTLLELHTMLSQLIRSGYYPHAKVVLGHNVPVTGISKRELKSSRPAYYPLVEILT